MSSEAQPVADSEPELATRPRLSMAMGIDFLFAALAAMGAAILLRQTSLPEEVPGYAAITVFLLYVFFSASLPRSGVGMWLFGVRVVSVRTGRPCSPMQSFVRMLLWVLRLGDQVAGTHAVIFKPHPEHKQGPANPVTPA